MLLEATYSGTAALSKALKLIYDGKLGGQQKSLMFLRSSVFFFLFGERGISTSASRTISCCAQSHQHTVDLQG